MMSSSSFLDSAPAAAPRPSQRGELNFLFYFICLSMAAGRTPCLHDSLAAAYRRRKCLVPVATAAGRLPRVIQCSGLNHLGTSSSSGRHPRPFFAAFRRRGPAADFADEADERRVPSTGPGSTRNGVLHADLLARPLGGGGERRAGRPRRTPPDLGRRTRGTAGGGACGRSGRPQGRRLLEGHRLLSLVAAMGSPSHPADRVRPPAGRRAGSARTRAPAPAARCNPRLLTA